MADWLSTAVSGNVLLVLPWGVLLVAVVGFAAILRHGQRQQSMRDEQLQRMMLEQMRHALEHQADQFLLQLEQNQLRLRVALQPDFQAAREPVQSLTALLQQQLANMRSEAAQLPDTNQVSAGRWHGDSREPQFSIEAGLAETFQLKLGDQVRFNISGREVEAPITSVRSLDWDSMRVNFFFIAAPGMLENDPASLITSFHLPAGDHAFITSLVRAFPNLTVIDVAALLEQIREMTDKLILIVQFVFGFAVLAGLVVLYASLQATHDEREFELAVLRTLGGRNDQLRRALLAEFAVLGGVAGVLAGVGSSAIAWALAEFVFKMAYVPSVLPVIAAVLAGGLSVVVGGWFGTRALLARPPLASLRALAA